MPSPDTCRLKARESKGGNNTCHHAINENFAIHGVLRNPTVILYDNACTIGFCNFACYHALMKSDLRITIKEKMNHSCFGLIPLCC